MCTCGSLQTRETKSCATFNQHEPNPSPHPTYNVENTYPQLFLTFNIVLGGGGGNCNVVLKYGNAFRRSAQIFNNYGFCITVPRYFVQDCRYLSLGVANGTSKILGLVTFSSDLKISTAFEKSLKVLFIMHILRSRSPTWLVSVSDFQTRVSASWRILGFYHSPPLELSG